MEYIQGISTQTQLFGYAFLTGLALGLLYCVFRFVRTLFGNQKAACYVADILYFLLCGIVVLFFNLVADEGRLRIYTVFGIALGAALFYIISAKISIRLCAFIIKVLRVIFLLIIAPFKFFKRKIGHLHAKMREIKRKRAKNSQKKSKNSLQNE